MNLNNPGGGIAGPASSTDTAIAVFSGTNGQVIKNTIVTISNTTGIISNTNIPGSGNILTASSGGTLVEIGWNSTGQLMFGSGGAWLAGLAQDGMCFGVNPVAWGNGPFAVSRDLFLARDAANVLGQRNGTNAQQTKIYGTYTDGSNYVRAAINTTSTTVVLACETAGTGADNIDLGLTPAGTGLVAVSTAASADAAVVSTHTVRMKFNGVEYKVLLATP